MKRKMPLIAFLFILSVAFSCRGADGTNGKDGKDGISGKDGVTEEILFYTNLVLVGENGNEFQELPNVVSGETYTVRVKGLRIYPHKDSFNFEGSYSYNVYGSKEEAGVEDVTGKKGKFVKFESDSLGYKDICKLKFTDNSSEDSRYGTFYEVKVKLRTSAGIEGPEIKTSVQAYKPKEEEEVVN